MAEGRLSTFCGLAGAAFFTVACSSDANCNGVGCTNGFETHASAGAPLAEGRYQLAFTIDGSSGTCEYFVPREAGGGSCDDSLPISVTPTDIGFIIVIDVAAKTVSVQIERNDERVASNVYEPSYRTNRFGSGECEQTCRVADPERIDDRALAIP